MTSLGIRREDKTEQERRAPLAPKHVKTLVEDHGIQVFVESNPRRVFTEDEYAAAGATIVNELPEVDFIIGVKEVPKDRFIPGKPHLIFSHVIKGQPYNMPMLQRILDLDVTLLDYELVADENGRRKIFFGEQAGQAGMINSLWSLGQRRVYQGINTPFAGVKQALAYTSLDEARDAIRKAGERVRSEGLASSAAPLVVGIAGYGSVSQGAQEILDLLDPEEISPAELLKKCPCCDANTSTEDRHRIYKVVFKEEDMVEPKDSSEEFDLQEYYDHPVKYKSKFSQYLPYMTVLVNAIFWTPDYPRIVTWDDLKKMYGVACTPPKLTVIGDVTCDPDGSIQSTVKATLPDHPTYVANPMDRSIKDGFEGQGVLMMTVDILPAEIPRESTIAFGDMLMPFMPKLLNADLSKEFDDLDLPPEFVKAVITHKGELVPEYKYLTEYLNQQS